MSPRPVERECVGNPAKTTPERGPHSEQGMSDVIDDVTILQKDKEASPGRVLVTRGDFIHHEWQRLVLSNRPFE